MAGWQKVWVGHKEWQTVITSWYSLQTYLQNSNVSISPGRTKMVTSDNKAFLAKRFYDSPQSPFVADCPSEKQNDKL